MADLENTKATLQRELDSLKQTRDELRVQLHLAAADAKAELDELETKWARVETELSRMGSHAKEPIAAIGHSATDLVNELKKGYARIRAQLKAP